MIKFLLFFIICFPSFLHAKQSNKVMKKEVSGQKLKYLLSVPEGNPDKNGWPLLLFLHGAGERGSDLEKVKVHGPPKLINKFPQLKNAIVISPQCPSGSWWIPSTLMALVKEVVKSHDNKIDKNVYILTHHVYFDMVSNQFSPKFLLLFLYHIEYNLKVIHI